MNYEIVTLEQKHVVGLAVRTSNAAPDMGERIGSLWQRLYGEDALKAIPDRIGENAYGLYTDYASGVDGEYEAIAGVETRGERIPEGFTAACIPAGTYAKFTAVVDMREGGVGAVWSQVWSTELNRAYTVDFEEYLPCDDPAQAVVNLYIALRR